jgi:hypothetical protein
MSASVKPRLAGRQPSNRGGVPRVMTWPFGISPAASAGPSTQYGPQSSGVPRE